MPQSSQTLTPSIRKQVQKIMAEDREGVLSVYFNLYATEADFRVQEARPVYVRIVQDMLEHYTDYIEVRLEVTPYQFAELVENHKNLRAHLLTKYKNQESTEKGEPFLEMKNRKVLIKNRRKLTQSLSTSQLENLKENWDDLITIDLELLVEDLYNIRKRTTQFIATDITMREVILTFCKAVGINRVHMVPPDNERVYTNFVMPSMECLASVFHFLQNTEGLGIYKQGCNYYYSEGILYIYPESDTDPSHGFTTHIYNAGTLDYQGLDNYHRVDESGDVHIISHGDVDIENLVQAGMENRLTGRVFYRTENVVDNWHTVNSDGRPFVDDDNVTVIDATPDAGIADKEEVSQGRVRPTYNNPFTEASEVAESYRNRMALQWNHAVPFLIKPSFPIKFHYDEPEDWEADTEKDKPARTMNGVCEKALFEIHRIGQQDEIEYACTGELQLAVDPLRS